MRISATLIPLLAFALAGLLSILAARAAVAVVEDLSVNAVQETLVEDGDNWASVIGDGLQIVIEGQAPSEALRFRAMSVAGGIVDASRVIDNMSVLPSEVIVAPPFAIEILRNDSGVSLIGLIPASTDREALAGQISAIAGDQPVTDLLEVADYPSPDNWRPSLNYALRMLDRLPRSKISISPGRVAVTAISDSAADKRRLETELARDVPAGVRLALVITAPRPVITPFTTRFILDADGARFDACAADTAEAQQLILAAAIGAGAEGQISCILGLGAPTGSWGEAVAMTISAVGEFGGGSATFSDADVVLIAPEGTDPAQFDRIVGELANALPEVFALEAVLPQASEVQASGPDTFTVTLSPEGQVQVRGRVADDLMNETAEQLAIARFGRGAVTMGTRVGEGLPMGWSVRMLAGIEALSHLSNGAVIVTPDDFTVRGNTGNTEASAEISRLLIERLGQAEAFSIDVTYVEALDPIAGLPTAEECLDQVFAVTADRKILFDPGSATLTIESQPIVDDLAEVLRQCDNLKIEVAGFTDSQGRDVMNLNLSQDRADAVLDALRARRVPVASFVAVGYGEADPIADNGTEEGREANRRIEFRLIEPEPVAEEITALEELETELADGTVSLTTADDAEEAGPDPTEGPADAADETDGTADETADGTAPEAAAEVATEVMTDAATDTATDTGAETGTGTDTEAPADVDPASDEPQVDTDAATNALEVSEDAEAGAPEIGGALATAPTVTPQARPANLAPPVEQDEDTGG